MSDQFDHREPRFREVQRFRQQWLWAFLGINGVTSTVLVVAVLYDSESGFTPTAIGWTLVHLGFFVGTLVVLHRQKLVTEVREDGLYLQFFPLQWSFRRVPTDRIDSAETTSYRPISDFGGWGLKWNPSISREGITFDGPKAYLVSGDEGVRVERGDDRPLVVGSQRPAELRRAIDAVRDPANLGPAPAEATGDS